MFLRPAFCSVVTKEKIDNEFHGKFLSKTGYSDKAFMPICHYKTRINDTSKLLNVAKIYLDLLFVLKAFWNKLLCSVMHKSSIRHDSIFYLFTLVFLYMIGKM